MLLLKTLFIKLTSFIIATKIRLRNSVSKQSTNLPRTTITNIVRNNCAIIQQNLVTLYILIYVTNQWFKDCLSCYFVVLFFIWMTKKIITKLLAIFSLSVRWVFYPWTRTRKGGMDERGWGETSFSSREDHVSSQSLLVWHVSPHNPRLAIPASKLPPHNPRLKTPASFREENRLPVYVV